MASLQGRLSSLITAIGADIKALKSVVIFTNGNTVDDTEQPTRAVEWRQNGTGGALLAKITEINPIENSVVVDRSELWLRLKSRSGGTSVTRKLLDSDGNSEFILANGAILMQATRTTAMNVGTASAAIVFNSVDVDSKSWYDNTTGRYTPQRAGWYLVSGNISFGAQTANSSASLELWKNGANYKRLDRQTNGGASAATWDLSGSALVQLNGTTDYIQLAASNTAGPIAMNVGASGIADYMSVNYIGS
jgi:hypothetical protein